MEKLITDEEAQELVLALADGHGQQGFTKEHAQKVLDWATQVRIDQGFLANVLEHKIAISVDDDGELCFQAPQREKGK